MSNKSTLAVQRINNTIEEATSQLHQLKNTLHLIINTLQHDIPGHLCEEQKFQSGLCKVPPSPAYHKESNLLSDNQSKALHIQNKNPPPKKEKERKYLTQQEIYKLLDVAVLGRQGVRNYCLVLLCFVHGLRASEVGQLRISDIDLAGRSISIRRLKRGHSTQHPLLKEECQAVQRWLIERDRYCNAESEWLFLSCRGSYISRQLLYQLFRRLGKQAGLGLPVHPHMLRHACGFALADRGADTRLIQDYLGHRNIRHTVWYTASNAARFQGIWARANPLGFCEE